MKQSILTRLTAIVTVVILISLTVISFTNYRMTYLKVKESAGIELYGCANITTGLLSFEDINKLYSLSKQEAAEIGEKIDWTLEHKPIFNNQYLLSPDGNVLVTDKYSEADGIKIGDSIPIEPDILKDLMETKEPAFSDVYEWAGMKRLSGYAPIFKDHNPENEIVAFSVIDFDAEILTERTWSMVSSTIIVGILSLLIAGVIIILYVRKTILPLRHLTEYTRQISKGDLSVEPQKLKTTGEIHILNENFNEMVDNLKQALLQTATTSEELSASTDDLSNNTLEITNIAEEITATFQHVAESAQHQEKESEQIQNVFHNIASQTNRIAERVQSTARNTAEASSFAMSGNELILESMEQMNDIQASTAEITSTMHELKEKSNNANEILTMIMSISKQTNLLALNASIESARAGEHGKGFAVVADEIRSLAEDTAKSIETINSIIIEIDNKIEEAVTLTEEGSKTVHTGIVKVQNAGTSFNEINEYTQSLNDEVGQIFTATKNIQEEIESANDQIEHITSIAKLISDQMQNVAASSEQQTASIEEVSSATQTLAHMANEMKHLSNRFRLRK